MITVVIMAGGSGTRFWPLSRESEPKQFLNIIGDRPMAQVTYERVKPLAPDERIIVAVGRTHLEQTKRIFSKTSVRILAEPFGRNTAPCIGLAAEFAARLGGDDPMIVLPADHFIANGNEFLDAVRRAVELASGRESIVTLGIVPTRPDTGYGYIQKDAEMSGSGRYAAYRVKSFKEKPVAGLAREYVASGDYFWNAGIFVATPSVFLKEFSVHMPDFHRGLESLSDMGEGRDNPEIRTLYERTENISFDYAVMEKTGTPVYVVPCNCGWSDVGSWDSLYDLRRPEGDEVGNIRQGDSLLEDCEGSFVVSAGKRWIAALGLKRMLVVDTDDALLVADLERSQDVRKITDYLKGRPDLKKIL